MVRFAQFLALFFLLTQPVFADNTTSTQTIEGISVLRYKTEIREPGAYENYRTNYGHVYLTAEVSEGDMRLIFEKSKTDGRFPHRIACALFNGMNDLSLKYKFTIENAGELSNSVGGHLPPTSCGSLNIQ